MTIHPQHKQGKKPKKRRKAIPKKIVKDVFERDAFTCQYSGIMEPEDNHTLHCHHILHRSQGGLDTVENLNACSAEMHDRHGEISKTDREWLKGDNVYRGGRITQQK